MAQPSHAAQQQTAGQQEEQVLNYLKQKGYANAALLMKKEMTVNLERKVLTFDRFVRY